MGDQADYEFERWISSQTFDDPDPEDLQGRSFAGKKIHETAKAILFHREGDAEPVWIPRSHTMHLTATEITITVWMAEQKGWEPAEVDVEEGDIPF